MKKLYLHIGTEKTGSTSIQHFLRDNKKQLSETGYFFHNNNTFKLARSFSEKIKNYHDVDSENVKKQHYEELINITKSCNNVIISCEFFHSRINTKSEIKNICDFFHGIFDEIVLICYLRDFAYLCESLYSTSIRFNNYINSDDKLITGNIPIFDQFVSECTPKHKYFNYMSFLDLWRNELKKENMKVALFNKESFFQGDLISDFSNKINLPLEESFNLNIPPKNESLSLEAQITLRAVHKGLKGEKRKKLATHIINNHSKKANLLSKAQYDKIFNDFLEVNISLNETFKLNKKSKLAFTYSPPKPKTPLRENDLMLIFSESLKITTEA